MTKFKITTDIRKMLLNNTGLTAYVENRIYPIIAPENTTGDTILYYREQYSRGQNQMGPYGDTCQVMLIVISDNYDKSTEIVELINNIVEGTHKDSSGNTYKCNLKDSTEDFEDQKYIQVLLFEIR